MVQEVNKGNIFRPSARDYLFDEIRRISLIAFVLFFLVFILSGIGCVYDMRFIFVGLILIFMIIPSFLFILWVKMSFRTDLIQKICPQEWVFKEDSDNIILRFYTPEFEFKFEKKIPYADIIDIGTSRGNYYIKTNIQGYKIIVIPKDILEYKYFEKIQNSINVKYFSEEDLA